MTNIIKSKVHIGFDIPKELHDRIKTHQSLREDELLRKVTINSICVDAIREYLDAQEYDQE